jgi:hypothetical protein
VVKNSQKLDRFLTDFLIRREGMVDLVGLGWTVEGGQRKVTRIWSDLVGFGRIWSDGG